MTEFFSSYFLAVILNSLTESHSSTESHHKTLWSSSLIINNRSKVGLSVFKASSAKPYAPHEGKLPPLNIIALNFEHFKV